MIMKVVTIVVKEQYKENLCKIFNKQPGPIYMYSHHKVIVPADADNDFEEFTVYAESEDVNIIIKKIRTILSENNNFDNSSKELDYICIKTVDSFINIKSGQVSL